MFLGVDRLDYSKGIIERLQGVRRVARRRLARSRQVLLRAGGGSEPDRHRGVRRDAQEVEDLVDRINMRHKRPDGTAPVHYMARRSTSTVWRVRYRAADALVVTSFADGMNLVAKEFVAARDDLGGSLVLSEFAGAAHDLPEALLINPFDIDAIKRRCGKRARCRRTSSRSGWW